MGSRVRRTEKNHAQAEEASIGGLRQKFCAKEFHSTGWPECRRPEMAKKQNRKPARPGFAEGNNEWCMHSSVPRRFDKPVFPDAVRRKPR